MPTIQEEAPEIWFQEKNLVLLKGIAHDGFQSKNSAVDRGDHLTSASDNPFESASAADMAVLARQLNEKLDLFAQRLSEEKKKLFFGYPSYETLRYRSQKTSATIAVLEAKVRRYSESIKRMQEHIRFLRQAGSLQAKNISQQAAALGEATHRSLHDVLTGLPNRQLFEEHLLLAKASSKRTGAYCAVLFLDLDKFKIINDTYGHTAGDALLVEVATRLRACVRESDTVARFGGDEFAVLVPALSVSAQTALSNANTLAEKVRRSLAAAFRIRLIGHGKALPEIICTISASIGGVLFHGADKSPHDLIQIADSMMYFAKRDGGDRVNIRG